MADINIGQFSEAFNNKADIDMGNVTQEGWDIVQDKLISYGGETVTATNNTGSAISAGDKVWVNENNGSYSIDNFDAGTINCTVVGNPFLYKGAVTSFSGGNYLTALSSLCEIGNTFYYHFRTGATPSSIARLYTLEGFDAVLLDTSNHFLMYSWSTQTFSTFPVTAIENTEYFVRVKAENGQRVYGASLDGGKTYMDLLTVTDTTYGPQPSETFYLGCYSRGEYWNGYIYLEDCFITNSNGIEIWRAYEPNVNENTLTGYAKENITSGSTGDVITRTQESKYGAKLDAWIGNVDGSGKLGNKRNNGNVTFTGVTDLGDLSLTYFMANNVNFSGVINFPDLKTITGENGFAYGLYRCYNASGCNFPELETITGQDCFAYAFRACTSLGSVSFPKLKSITSGANFSSAFYQSLITEVSFPELEEISSSNAFQSAFQYTSISNLEFPKLSKLTGGAAFYRAFAPSSLIGSPIQSISFPALTTTSFGTVKTQFNNMLQYTSNVTVHFPSNLQTVVSDLTGYSNGFGSTTASILFDLPATS